MGRPSRVRAGIGQWFGARLWSLWYAGWKPGPVFARAEGPVFVSVTDFQIHAWRHGPRAWWTALKLRRSWPRVEGAIGLWLWSEPLELRSGSVSIWRHEDDLTRFIRSPLHRSIVREFRCHMTGTASSWTAPALARRAIWIEATRRLRRPAQSAIRQ